MFPIFMVLNKKDAPKIDINDVQQVKDVIQGKWSYEEHNGHINETTQYRFEIVGNQLKIWKTIGNMADSFDMGHEPTIHEFTLGEAVRDVDGQPCRYLNFDESDVSLTYRAIAPIWVVSNPVKMKCYSGFPSWDKGWKNSH